MAFNFSNTGLKILSGIKGALNKQVDLKKIKSRSNKTNHSTFDLLLNKHVSELGEVNYEGFRASKTELEAYLNHLSEGQPDRTKTTESEQKAYWINAYNAFTIALIISGKEVKSIKELGGGIPMVNSPWDIKFFDIGGEPMDLNTIEHEILRKWFDDPRIHFALNCASGSCPILKPGAYSGQDLDAELDEQAKVFLNDGSKNAMSAGKLELSKIFKWYEADFKSQGGVKKFIEKYSDLEIDENADLDYQDYDWSLNDKKE